MAGKRELSGGEEIVRAEELFKKSAQDGNPDFRFVALAIASQPDFPPPWAMLACISELEATRRRAAVKPTAKNEMDAMLDGIARAYIEELDRRDGPKLAKERVPSFNEMVRRAYRETFGEPLPKASENDTYRKYKRKWDAEQANAATDSGSPFLGIKVTPRIEAITNEFYGAQLNGPERLERTLYIAHVIKWAEDRDIDVAHLWRSSEHE